MKRVVSLFCTLVACAFVSTASAQTVKVEYLKAEPLATKIHGPIKPLQTGPWVVDGLTWGGDVATLHGIKEGNFKAEGLDVKFQLENDPVKIAQDVIDGKVVMFRGTMGQVSMFAEAIAALGDEVVVLVQLTYSSGGDVLCWVEPAKFIRDLKGQTGVAQLYAPHLELLFKALKDDKIAISEVPIRYVREITVHDPNASGQYVDPASAFLLDGSNKWAMLISPDAATLTSKGAESRAGAKRGLDSSQADKVIADVYAVPKSRFNAHRDKFLAFTRAFLKSQESLEDLKKSKAAPKWPDLLTHSAEVLLGDKTKTGDVEGMLADCKQVGVVGNHAFLTGQGTSRNVKNMAEEYQPLFIEAGLMTKKAPVSAADWDFNALRKGLKYVDEPLTPNIEYDPAAIARNAEMRLESTKFGEGDEDMKFEKEIYFAPDSFVFNSDVYNKDFDEFIDLLQSYGGLEANVEGHGDPTGLIKLERKLQGTTNADDRQKLQTDIERYPQKVKNLSLLRAQKVAEAIVKRAEQRGLKIDVKQIAPVGVGIRNPKFPRPTTEQQWKENYRARLTLVAKPVESTTFEPEPSK